MNEVPKMISTKDLSLIDDMINYNITYSKKTKHYKEIVCDTEIESFLDKVDNMYIKHANELLKLLG